ncbi:TolC family protein [Asticcacaulis sp. 201]|uniref:TolC family protein n=1 Tax=Asticcacaulis sp. 201 TaxID=3028787 RepID=UPI0029160CC5|nr:TolC family protein [Asticcacaulis sp. 201]MDV6330647.1 TolC family protein [Asticcacaulis sp. 201]
MFPTVRFQPLALGLYLAISGSILTGCASYQPAPLNMATLGQPRTGLSDFPLDADRPTLLRFALSHDPTLTAARAALHAAEQAQKSARNLPSLSLTLTAEYSRDADPKKPWLYGGALGIPLDLGARRQARVTAADLAAVKARYALAEAAWRVRQQFQTAAVDADLAGREVGIAQSLLDRRAAYLAVLQARVNAGEDARGLAAQAALDVSGARQALAQAQANKTQAIAALAHLLDTDPATAESLPAIALAPLAEVDPSEVTTRIDAALYARADVLTAVIDYDLAENDLRQAIAAQYPDINIQPGYTWERGQVKLPLSLSLTLPPLDGNRAVINAAQSTRLAAGKTLEAVVRSTRSTASQAATAYGAGLATARTITDSDLPAARDMAARTERMRTAGESDTTEVQLAQINATQAALSALQAERNARMDRLALEDALHQSLDATDTLILADVLAETATTEVHK